MERDVFGLLITKFLLINLEEEEKQAFTFFRKVEENITFWKWPRDQQFPIWVVSDILSDIPKFIAGGSCM